MANKLTMESIGEALSKITTPADADRIVVEPEDVEDALPSWEDPARPCCRGGGWVRRDVPVGDPAFGKLMECPCGLILGRRLANCQTTNARLEGAIRTQNAAVTEMQRQGEARATEQREALARAQRESCN